MEDNILNLNKYLNKLFEHDEVDESIFPMDSVHTGKGPLKIVHDDEDDLNELDLEPEN